MGLFDSLLSLFGLSKSSDSSPSSAPKDSGGLFGDMPMELTPTFTPPNAVEIADLLREAGPLYPNKDPAKALALYRKAIALMEPAPASPEVQEQLDFGDVGFAIWAAWVCMGHLDLPEEESTDLLDLARSKSPMTAKRIEERIAEIASGANEWSESPERQESRVALTAITGLLRSENSPHAEDIRIACDALLDKAKAANAWWDLRSAGVALTKSKQHDAAWRLFNAALLMAMASAGNLASLYEAMGDACKSEGKHQNAARQYLLACCYGQPNPTKRAVDQVRISLKKAGLKRTAAEARDTLLSKIGSMEPSDLVQEMDLIIAAVDN